MVIETFTPGEPQGKALKKIVGSSKHEKTSHARSHISCVQEYKIKDMRQSESALVLFVQQLDTKRKYALKKLLPYKDARYDLETAEKRLDCQLEALKWNRIFSPSVYLGLARLDKFNSCRETITISHLIRDPKKEELDVHADYVLVMRWLDEGKQLSDILDAENILSIKAHLELLARYIGGSYIKNLESLPNATSWGNPSHIQKKFKLNIDFLEETLRTYAPTVYQPALSACLNSYYMDEQIKNDYQRYFEQRMDREYIKKCHGDLKATNIWIMPDATGFWGRNELRVYLLDAIDFNPVFNNIDILSDFAMLVIDIEVRLRLFSSFKCSIARSLVDEMVNVYLDVTKQQDEVSRAVLAYYLLEKAIVCAGVSALDATITRHASIGYTLEALDVAKMRLEDALALKKEIRREPTDPVPVMVGSC